MKKQQGFTLIELIVVIVILGILAATALPKFVDLSTDAKMAAVKGVASGLTSAGSINYAARAVNSSVAGTIATSGNTDCGAIADTIMQGGRSAGYTYGTGTQSNGVISCSVTDNTLSSASAVATIPATN